MNPKSRWIIKTEQIPWVALEKEYAKFFFNSKGNIAEPLRMALGTLLIQMFYNWSDEEVVQSIQENLYLQFSIGVQGYQQEKSFDATTLAEINKKSIAFSTPLRDIKTDEDVDHHYDGSNSESLIINATCALPNTKYPIPAKNINDAFCKTHEYKTLDL